MRISITIALVGVLLSAIPLLRVEGKGVEAKEILARVDSVIDYPKGIVKGKIIHSHLDGKSFFIDIVGYISDSEYLFSLSSRTRGDLMRVLYTHGGEDIWVYDISERKLSQNIGADKFNTILNTNFNFADLSNADLQRNYSAISMKSVTFENDEIYKLQLEPVFRGGNYGMLTLYVRKRDLVPLRIDYFNNEKIFFKSISFTKTVMRGDRVFPVRYKMIDIERETVSILFFTGFEENVHFDKRLFRHQNLHEKL